MKNMFYWVVEFNIVLVVGDDEPANLGSMPYGALEKLNISLRSRE